MMKQPQLILLCGLPGSGKSTFSFNNHLNENTTILSTDVHIEMSASCLKKTYNEVFKDYIKEAENLLEEKLKIAISNKHNVIWDQTNLTHKSRQRKLQHFPRFYIKKAVVFIIDDKTLFKRNEERKSYGRDLPEYVLNNMRNIFSIPTIEEGFDEVQIIS